MATKAAGDDARQPSVPPPSTPARQPWIERKDWFERRDD